MTVTLSDILSDTLSLLLSLSAFILAGALSWTLSEYVLHRYIGHSKSPLGGFTHEHRAHHKSGDYFMPILKKVFVSVKVIAPLCLISMWLLGGLEGGCFTAGFTAMFICYEILHKRAHTHAPLNAYGRWLRRHHFTHHFSAPRKNFGVTTPLWDLVFRTYQPASQIRLPAKKAMIWLIDPQTQEILPKFQADYQLRGVRSALRA